ncbi:MAG: YbaB/EbfC family nucleoid-associated protein [Treponema sp.]|jgi:DNA-binding YbaB/EbfC family protein|nr:YbaB/EbfC family nucleoid-associated protein [Treponema sp.]
MNINPFDILKNAQKIQDQMGDLQEKLRLIQVTGSAGGGMVEIDITGKIEVSAVRIANEVMESGDAEMLQDLITAAFSNGIEKARELINQEMTSMASGMGISGLPGFSGLFPGAGL